MKKAVNHAAFRKTGNLQVPAPALTQHPPGSGDMQTGLITESGYQYYLSPADGHMLTGAVQVPGFPEPMQFNETLPPAPTYTLDPLSGIWKRNAVDALPYGARLQ